MEIKIVRRLDDLGRVSLPKDIRKTVRIAENEPVEISVENGKIVINKFNPLNNMESVAKPVLEALAKYYGVPAVLCDPAGAIYSAGIIIPPETKYSEKFSACINDCGEYEYGSDVPELHIDRDRKYKAAALIPVISGSNPLKPIGAFILLCASGPKRTQAYRELDSLRFAAFFIAGQVII